MYHVIYRATGETYRTFTKLAIAKRYARGLGASGEDDPQFNGYLPIAYVADDDGNMVYSPRFGKNISSSVSSIIHSQDDCLRN